MNDSTLPGYAEAQRRRPHGFGRWSRPGPFPRGRFGPFPRHSDTLPPVVRPVTANRVVECVSSVYRYAATCGLIDRGFNPAACIVAFREQRRERFLTTEELSRLGEAIRDAETTGVAWEVDQTKPTAKHLPNDENRRTLIGPHAAAALRLLILTRCAAPRNS